MRIKHIGLLMMEALFSNGQVVADRMFLLLSAAEREPG